VALDGARAQRRPSNRRWASPGGGGALGSHGQSEREGEGVGQRAQMREGRWASRARCSKGAQAHRRGQRTHGRGRVHGGEIVGRRLETTDRWRQRDRERVGTGKRIASTALAHGVEREREGGSERAGLADRWDPPVRRMGRAGAGERAEAGLNGLKCPFPFSWNFYCLFHLFSLGFSIQTQIKFQIQTKSNMCNNSKNI
jgi:hypothetical protein